MIPVGFKPADPHIVALVLPVLLQIDDWRQHGRTRAAVKIVETVTDHWCIDCSRWRGAGNGETYHTGWCNKWLVPAHPTASQPCFEG